MKVTMLIGVETDAIQMFGLDRTTPWLAGAISHDMMEHLPYEDEDRWWSEMKAKVTPEPELYTWRSIVVDLDDAQILKHFAGPVVAGTVSEPEDGERA